MSYIGENSCFSFRDGFCEGLPHTDVTAADAARLGSAAAGLFGRFSVGCGGFAHNSFLYALCGGISSAGGEVYVCENTDLPSFLFGCPLVSADCGIYVSGSSAVRVSFFGKNGFPLGDRDLARIMDAPPAKSSQRCGRVTHTTSFRSLYSDSIRDALSGKKLPISAGVSCGNKAVRSLWLEFFTGEDDSLVFQVSDDGQRVNAYSTQAGFISYEKLILAYLRCFSPKGQAVWLPRSFHFSADTADRRICRFSEDMMIPEAAASQRFLKDPLFVCTQLASERRCFLGTLSELPEMASVRRDIAVTVNGDIPVGKTISENGGRIIITQSGKNRLSLLAQACSTETAAEICSSWNDRLRRLSNKSSRTENSQNY